MEADESVSPAEEDPTAKALDDWDRNKLNSN